LLKLRPVGSYMMHVRPQIEMHMEPLGFSFYPANLHHIRYCQMRIDRNESQLHFVPADSSEIEQIIN
jgi:hypothetical protein